MGDTMRLKEDQIMRLAGKILEDLMAQDVISLKKERGSVLNAIKEAVTADIRKEDELEKEAERIMDQAIRAAGEGNIDRFKMLKMIKEKLAKDRKMVL